MSAAKKISHLFNRVATHGSTAMVALALSVGGGVYSYNKADSTHETVAPLIDAERSAFAEQSLRAQSDLIMQEQARLDFTARSLAKMQDNLGTQGGTVKSQLQELGDARAQFDRDTQAQMKRLADFRRILWLNPSLSEKQADKIYTDLFYAAQGKGLSTINDFLAPMTDALTLRTETIQKLNMRYEESHSHVDVQKLVEAARAADAAHDKAEVLDGIMMGLMDAAVLFGWMGVGFIGRRKEEKEAAEQEAENLARRRTQDDAEANRRAEAAAAQHATVAQAPPAKKSATGGKFTV